MWAYSMRVGVILPEGSGRVTVWSGLPRVNVKMEAAVPISVLNALPGLVPCAGRGAVAPV